MCALGARLSLSVHREWDGDWICYKLSRWRSLTCSNHSSLPMPSGNVSIPNKHQKSLSDQSTTIWGRQVGRLCWCSEVLPTHDSSWDMKVHLKGIPLTQKGLGKRWLPAGTAPVSSGSAPTGSRGRGHQPGRPAGPPEDGERSRDQLPEHQLAALARSLRAPQGIPAVAAPRRVRQLGRAPGPCPADHPRLERTGQTYLGGGSQRSLRPAAPQGGRSQLSAVEHGSRHF